MKLFQQLLIAPAALGLLAPIAANADVIENVKDLNAGAFASATKVTGGSVFTTGFIDQASTADNKLTVEYNYTIDLNTSFTGMDNLYAGIEAGNQGDIAMDSAVNVGNGLSVSTLYYQFPLGDFTVTAGPRLNQDDVISATTSVYSSAFRLAEMPWGSAGDLGAGVGVSYIADNGWNGSFNLLAQDDPNGDGTLTDGVGDDTIGAFTEESADQYTASIGYDAANYGGGFVYTSEDQVASDTKDESYAAGIYFRPDGFPTISLVIDKLEDEDGVQQTDVFIGLDHPVGDGTLSAGYQARDNGTADVANYEVYYNYPINDGVAVQGGIFSEESATDDNTQGFVVETFFSF